MCIKDESTLPKYNKAYRNAANGILHAVQLHNEVDSVQSSELKWDLHGKFVQGIKNAYCVPVL